jgi:small subunit ribosomal protein S9
MADEETPETPAEPTPSTPDEQAQPAAEAQGASAEPTPEHAVPTEEATEIAAVVEDAPLEALQEAAEAEQAGSGAAEQPAAAEPAAPEQPATPEQPDVQAQPAASQQEPAEAESAVSQQEPVEEEPVEVERAATERPSEAPVAEDTASEEQADAEDEEEPAPRVKPSVPGAHLEVDIVPEGVDPLGRDQGYVDPYAIEDDSEQQGEGERDEREEEALSGPISTAAIDLASGARYRATGKRKTAIARVTLRPGSGSYLVNGRALEEHFPRITLQRNIRQPLETVGYQERMDVVARLHGGGISAQAGALRHGVSRALLEADPNLRGELKRRGFLTRDSRAKERKKAGLKKARKRPQFSKR